MLIPLFPASSPRSGVPNHVTVSRSAQSVWSFTTLSSCWRRGHGDKARPFSVPVKAKRAAGSPQAGKHTVESTWMRNVPFSMVLNQIPQNS